MAKPPRQFKQLVERYPSLAEAYGGLGEAAKEAGPLDERSACLVKLGIAIGMQHEGATHAHTRKALDAGCAPDELRHAALLAATTLGWPRMMAAYMWVEDELAARGDERVVDTEGLE
jgi:4-carboxymuconolactone decarboxylase